MSGPCAKRVVWCRIENEHPSGEVEYVEASNSCETPQTSCPRAPGEDYTKCKTVCGQRGHAELRAIELARRAGIYMGVATAIVTGHYCVCRDCGEALWNAGVRKLVLQMAAP